MNTDILQVINDEISILYYKLKFTKREKRESVLAKIRELEEKYKEKMKEGEEEVNEQ